MSHEGGQLLLAGAKARGRRVITATRDERSFACELDSVRAARHFVTAALSCANEAPATDCPVVDDAGIVVTELAANAVVHARSAFTVTLVRSAGAVTILVRDCTPVKRESGIGPFAVRQGHGLSVVTQLARQWGIDRTSDGKVVWVELPLPREAGPRRDRATAADCRRQRGGTGAPG